MSTASHFNINSNHTPYIITGSSLFLLSGFLTLSFLQPFSIDNSYATDNDATVNVADNLSISATPVSITDTPEASGSWLTGTSNVVVSTNNATGYKLYMSSSDSQVDLVNSDNNSYKIETLSTETTESTFKSDDNLMNHYGFTHDNNGSDTDLGQITSGTYLPVTDVNNARLINATEEKQNISTTNVTFATKVDRSIPAGEYTNTITFTAIANPEVKNYLQDMDAVTCAALAPYDSTDSDATTYTFTDKRDNQNYRVRRLRMGTSSDTACWMVDNLKLTKTSIENAGGSAILDASTSNVASDSVFELTTSDSDTWCTTNSGACKSKSMLIDTGDEYGVLYNWHAATAGTGLGSAMSSNATASICPGKGIISSSTWHLPTGNRDNEWYNLFAAYQSEYDWSTITGSGNSTANNLSTTIGPDFVYSGNRTGGNTSNQGVDGIGYWWSSTAKSADNQYAFYAGVYSSGYVGGGTLFSSKYEGFSVRCVLSSAQS